MNVGGMIVVGIALAAVVLILAAGLSTLFIGGDVSRRWSNRLMRYRVLAQAVAILIVLAVLYFARAH
jgi:tryptophan-rich sensory protein